MEKEKPNGVIIIGLLTLFSGSIGLLLVTRNPWWGTFRISIGLLMVILTATGIGLIMFKEWARKSELTFMISSLILTVLLLTVVRADGEAMFQYHDIWLSRNLIALAIIIYLMMPKIKEHFE